MLPREQRNNVRRIVAVNREVADTAVKAMQANAGAAILAAIQTGGIDLGMQMNGPHLSELLGKLIPPRGPIRSALLLLGWQQLLRVRDADEAAYAALERGELSLSDLPFAVETHRDGEISTYVASTGADRGLIEEETTLFLKLAHGQDEVGWYGRWKFQAVRGLLTGRPDWRDDQDIIEEMHGATYAAVFSRELAEFNANLIGRHNPIVVSSVEHSALFQTWFDFRKS